MSWSFHRLPSLEIHIPISPNSPMLNMVQCLALSLRRFGGAYRNAPIILTIGDSTIDRGLASRNRWMARLGVEARFVPEAAFRQHSYYATGFERFEHDFRSDVVLFLDADILVAGPFDEFIRDVHRQGNFAGVIALASPLISLRPPSTWGELYALCGIDRRPEICHEYTGWPYFLTDDRAHRFGPAYFNYGVIAAPSAMLKRLGPAYARHLWRLRERVDSVLVSQIALTMAVVDLDLPYHVLPMRYNFPNDLAVEALHGLELPHASFLHLFGKLQIEKSQLYGGIDQIRAILGRDDLRGVSRKVQQIIAAIEADLVEPSPSTLN